MRKRRFEYYCDDFENIENYEKALADNFVGWECHHRLETHNSDGERRIVDISQAELIALNMYYNRPSSELIFMTKSEHSQYNKGKHRSEEQKKKMKGRPAWNKGRKATDEEIRKNSESHKGQVAWNKGLPMPDKQRIKMEEIREAYRKSGRKDWNTF